MAPVAARLASSYRASGCPVLENTRFNAGETKNDPGYAAELAAGGICT